jgi:hypothetical protein
MAHHRGTALPAADPARLPTTRRYAALTPVVPVVPWQHESRITESVGTQ